MDHSLDRWQTLLRYVHTTTAWKASSSRSRSGEATGCAGLRRRILCGSLYAGIPKALGKSSAIVVRRTPESTV